MSINRTQMLLDGAPLWVNNGDLAREWLRLKAELLSSLQNSIAAILHHCREAMVVVRMLGGMYGPACEYKVSLDETIPMNTTIVHK